MNVKCSFCGDLPMPCHCQDKELHEVDLEAEQGWVGNYREELDRIRCLEEALKRSRYWFPNPWEVDNLLDSDAQRAKRRADYDFVDKVLGKTSANPMAERIAELEERLRDVAELTNEADTRSRCLSILA